MGKIHQFKGLKGLYAHRIAAHQSEVTVKLKYSETEDIKKIKKKKKEK